MEFRRQSLLVQISNVPIRIGLALGLLIAVSGAALAERRALVIGNNDYANVTTLRKAVGDAEAMKTTLEKLGFTVSLALNVDRGGFGDAIDDFAASVSEGDETLIFYAGHGIAIDGRNFLLPVDIEEPEPGRKRRVERNSYEAQEIIEAVREKKPKYVFAVFDACRNNPFEGAGRSIGMTRGLARMEARPGAFILFSAGPGETALDRLGNDDKAPTSVFTRILLKHIVTPGLSLQEIANATQRHVRDLALTVDHQQFPDYSDRMADEAVLVAGTAPAPADATWDKASADTAIRLALLDRSPEALEKIIREYPGHPRIGEVLDLLEARDDDAAFAAAEKSGTLDAYQRYLSNRPKGLHAAAARKALAILKAPPPIVSLRSVPDTGGQAFMLTSMRLLDVIPVITFSPDGRLLAVVSGDGSLRLWDVTKGRLVETIETDSHWNIHAVAFTSDNRKVFTGENEAVKLWDVETGRPLWTLAMRFSTRRPLALSPDGRMLVVGDKGAVRIVNPETGERLRTVEVHKVVREGVDSGSVTAMTFSPDGRTIASGDYHGRIVLWDARTGETLRKFEPRDIFQSVRSIAFSPDGSALAAWTGQSNGGSQLQLWNIETGQQAHTMTDELWGGKGVATSVDFSPNGRIVASGAGDQTVKLWDAKTGRLLRSLEGHQYTVRAVAFSPNGRLLASGGYFAEAGKDNIGDGVRLWDMESGRTVVVFRALPRNEWVVLGHDGYIASAGAHKHLRLTRDGGEFSVDEDFKKRWLKKNLPSLAVGMAGRQ